MTYKTKFKKILTDLSKIPSQTVRFRAVGKEVMVTSNPKVISELYARRDITRSGFSRRMLEHMGADHSSVSQDDEKAKIKRHFMKKHLKASTYEIISDQVTKQLFETLSTISENGETFNPIGVVGGIIGNSLLSNVLGAKLPDDAQQELNRIGLSHKEHGADVSTARMFFLNYVPFVPRFVKDIFAPGLKKRNENLDVLAELVYTKAIGRRGSLFYDLMQAEQEGVLTKEDVKGEIRMLIINGNSLAGAVMWMLYVISKNPQHAVKVANDGSYARWAFMEVLRIYPPFHLLSYEPKEKSKCPFHFWKSSTDLVSVRDTHMSEQNWKQPEVFDPKRFAKGLSSIEKGSYIPFGGGERGCPGSGLTMKVGPDVMQMICKNFVVVLEQEPIIKRRIELTPKGNKIFFKLKKVKHANED